MKLKKLYLQNFQDHYQTTIEFGKTFNCLVGATNSGKSSIARALTFIFYGDWVDDYIAHGTKETIITATLDNDITITRIKSAIENTLILTKGKEEYKFEKIGRALPAQFYQLLQLAPISLDTDREIYLTIANQDDPYFLLSESGPTRTKILGKLAGLHIADAAIRSLSTDRKGLSTEKHYLTEQLENNQKQLPKFSKLFEYKSLVQDLIKVVNSLKLKEQRLRMLEILSNNLVELRQKQFLVRTIKAQSALPTLETVNCLESKYKYLTAKEQDLLRLHQNLQRIKNLKNQCQEQFSLAKQRYEEILLQAPQCPLCKTELTGTSITSAVASL